MLGSGLAAACDAPSSPPPPSRAGPSITIGSPSLAEQVIVADLYADVLTHAGARVTVRTDLGTRDVGGARPGRRPLDLYPDYAGTLLLFLDSDDTRAATQTSTAVPALKAPAQAWRGPRC